MKIPYQVREDGRDWDKGTGRQMLKQVQHDGERKQDGRTRRRNRPEETGDKHF